MNSLITMIQSSMLSTTYLGLPRSTLMWLGIISQAPQQSQLVIVFNQTVKYFLNFLNSMCSSSGLDAKFKIILQNCQNINIYRSLVGWGGRIHQLHLCRGVRPPPKRCTDMPCKLHLIVRLWPWRVGECRVPLHCYCSLVHYDPEW